eukprot:3287624-Prymnesium_polylepis.1
MTFGREPCALRSSTMPRASGTSGSSAAARSSRRCCARTWRPSHRASPPHRAAAPRRACASRAAP